MAKNVYIGVSGKARKIKKIYFGVSGVARKVKKAYVGIGGVARPFFSLEPVEYYGTLEQSINRINIDANHIGNYALYAGGSVLNDYSNTTVVDAYDTSLTRKSATPLSVGRSIIGTTHIGDYALFAGGDDGTTNYSDVVDAYSSSLTRSTPTSLSVSRGNMGATHVGNYALFGGGTQSRTVQKTLDAYNISLTHTTATSFNKAAYSLGATHVGNYALFAGGYDFAGNGIYLSDVYAYNASLTQTFPTTLSVARRSICSAHNENYAIFAGGSSESVFNETTVDAYNSSLTRVLPEVLPDYLSSSLSSGHYGACSGRFAIFSKTKELFSYDESLTLTTFSNKKAYYQENGDCSISLGKYIFTFGGHLDFNTDEHTYGSNIWVNNEL